MKSDKIMNSKIYHILDYIFRLIILNFLIFLISLSFLIIIPYFNDSDLAYYLALIPTAFTFLPAIVSCFNVIKQYEEGNFHSIIKPFFKSFKKYYLKTVFISFIIVIVAVLLNNSITVFYQQIQNGLINLIGLILTLAIIFMMILALVHLPLVIVYFDDLKLIHYLKLSFLFAFKDLLLSFIMTIIIIIIFMLNFTWPHGMIFIGFSLPIYVLIKLSSKLYIKYSNN